MLRSAPPRKGAAEKAAADKGAAKKASAERCLVMKATAQKASEDEATTSVYAKDEQVNQAADVEVSAKAAAEEAAAKAAEVEVSARAADVEVDAKAAELKFSEFRMRWITRHDKCTDEWALKSKLLESLEDAYMAPVSVLSDGDFSEVKDKFCEGVLSPVRFLEEMEKLLSKT